MQLKPSRRHQADHAASQENPILYIFDDFEFDTASLELKKAGQNIPLRVQPARLLKILVENTPDVVLRRTLQAEIWDNGTTVEFEQGLNACVNQLRAALGDTANDAKYIETLPKRGYRFKAELETKRHSNSLQKRTLLFGSILVSFLFGAVIWFSAFHATPQQPTRIFVAPVESTDSGIQTQDDVVQYALRIGTIEQLMRNDVKVLQVINGVSLWRDTLGTSFLNSHDYVLNLSIVSVEKKEFSVNAAIFDAAAGRQVAQNKFSIENLDSGNLADLSGRIADWAASTFGVVFDQYNEQPPVTNPAYYEAMIKARRFFQVGDTPSLTESVTWFDRALAIAPTSIDAKGGKAAALVVLAGKEGFPVTETYKKALTLADEIRQASGPTAQSELVRGFIFLYRDWDIEKSRNAFDSALELSPGEAVIYNWRAGVLAAQGETDAAANAVDIAVQLDPLSMSINADRCWYLAAANRFEEAISACNWVIELKPEHDWSRIGLAAALQKVGRDEEAKIALEPFVERLTKQSNSSNFKAVKSASLTSMRDVHCYIADHLAPAAERGKFPFFQLAAFEAQCGRFARASELLEFARRERESGILFYPIDPRFDEFRSFSDDGS